MFGETEILGVWAQGPLKSRWGQMGLALPWSVLKKKTKIEK